jgi:hypothetical protein
MSVLTVEIRAVTLRTGTMALGSTQRLTEMSTRILKKETWGVKGGRHVGLTILPPSVSRLSK